MTKLECYTCKSIFTRKRYRPASKHFCGQGCRIAWYKIRFKDDGNPNYKDGTHIKEQYCQCGAAKDYRSSKCARCANRSVPKDGWNKYYADMLLKIKDKIDKCDSYSLLAKEVGCTRATVTKIIKTSGIDTSHFKVGRNRVKPPESYFTMVSKRNNGTIKKIILKHGIIKYECKICAQPPEWNGKILTLELDHVDGNPLNNKIENLRFLCPNCHSQTPTCKGKNCTGTVKRRFK